MKISSGCPKRNQPHESQFLKWPPGPIRQVLQYSPKSAEGSEIGLFITYGNQDSLYKGASLYKNVKSKAVGSSKGSLKWKQTPQVFLRSNRPVMIYAYSPYKVQIPLDPTSIPIKISPIAAETPPYEYGSSRKAKKRSTVNLARETLHELCIITSLIRNISRFGHQRAIQANLHTDR